MESVDRFEERTTVLFRDHAALARKHRWAHLPLPGRDAKGGHEFRQIGDDEEPISVLRSDRRLPHAAGHNQRVFGIAIDEGDCSFQHLVEGVHRDY